MNLHPTALVHADAELADDVEVGPWSIIDGGAHIGSGVVIGPRAWITGDTTIGDGCEIHCGAVVGHEPQDRAFVRGSPGGVIVGRGTVIREYATIHRATKPGAYTTIGAHCFLMANAHVAHDCLVEDDVILCNNALVAGHVTIGERAFLSGNVVIHQFARVGAGCMISGGSGLGQDAPPFTTIAGRSVVRALNVIGMRRAGFDGESRTAVKNAYRRLFALRSELARAVASLDDAPDLPAIRTIRDFYRAGSRRGFAWPERRRDDLADEGAEV